MRHQHFSVHSYSRHGSVGTETLVQRVSLRGASRRLWLAGSLAAILATAMITFAAPTAHAGTTIVVTTTADETVTDGNCSLEEAIQAANTDTAVDACPAGSGADTIVLAAGATYTLNIIDNATNGPTGLPIITSAITIEGNGATITRSAASGTPAFRMAAIEPGADLTVSNLTVSNFDAPMSTGNPARGARSSTAAP
jgi:CSLREA domain-containing protein